MDKDELIQCIEKELNSETLINKFLLFSKERGYSYSEICFSDIQITPKEITIKILMR